MIARSTEKLCTRYIPYLHNSVAVLSGNYLLRFLREGGKSGTRTRETHVVRCYAHDSTTRVVDGATFNKPVYYENETRDRERERVAAGSERDAADARALIEVLKANVMFITMTIQFRRWNAR